MVRALHPCAVLVCVLLLAGCGNTMRTQPLNRSQALARTEVLELTVVKVWDVVGDALDHDREPGISHIIEVDVRSGPSAGQQFALPYDEWNVGAPPPPPGATVVVAPADWVKRAKDSRGRPVGGW